MGLTWCLHQFQEYFNPKRDNGSTLDMCQTAWIFRGLEAYVQISGNVELYITRNLMLFRIVPLKSTMALKTRLQRSFRDFARAPSPPTEWVYE